MKTTMKILSIALVAVMLLAAISPVFADGMLSAGSIKPSYDQTATKDMSEIAGRIIGLLRNIAVIAGVLLLTVIGIKFMLGSAEEKAEYKKSLVPLVVGIIVVMAATQIATMIFGFFDKK